MHTQHLMKRGFIVAWLCCMGVLRAATPNVLYIVVDDLKADIASFGESAVRTPNIDRLVARGVKFDHAYCQFP